MHSGVTFYHASVTHKINITNQKISRQSQNRSLEWLLQFRSVKWPQRKNAAILPVRYLDLKLKHLNKNAVAVSCFAYAEHCS